MKMNHDFISYPENLLKEIFFDEPCPNHTAAYFSDALQQTLDELPKNCEKAILYRYKDGMTYRRAGEILGVSGTRVRQLVGRGLRLLRNDRCRSLLEGKTENETQSSNTDIRSMRLSTRAFNCLVRGEIYTVDDILAKTPEELMAVRNLGKKSYDEIITRLEERGCDVSAYRAKRK